MFRFLSAIFILGFVIASFAAADDFVTTWTAPDAEPMYLAGKKIAVLVMSQDRASRLSAEKILADDITSRGAEGLSARELIPESELSEREKSKARLKEANVSAILVIQPTAQYRTKLTSDQSFWNSYPTDSDAGYSGKNVKIYIESKVFSLDQDKLVWIGTSVTKASDVVKFTNKLTKLIGEQLQKQGLLQKQ